MLVLLVYLERDQSHTRLCAMYLQGFVQRWPYNLASLNCFSRLIGLISLIEIIGATTQCQGICGFLRHFPCKYCAMKINSIDLFILNIPGEVINKTKQVQVKSLVPQLIG